MSILEYFGSASKRDRMLGALAIDIEEFMIKEDTRAIGSSILRGHAERIVKSFGHEPIILPILMNAFDRIAKRSRGTASGFATTITVVADETRRAKEREHDEFSKSPLVPLKKAAELRWKECVLGVKNPVDNLDYVLNVHEGHTIKNIDTLRETAAQALEVIIDGIKAGKFPSLNLNDRDGEPSISRYALFQADEIVRARRGYQLDEAYQHVGAPSCK